MRSFFTGFYVIVFVVYYYSTKREPNRRLIHECRCDERLNAKADGSTHLAYTGSCGGLEHPKIETSLIDERLNSVMGDCDLEAIVLPSIIRSAATLARMLPTFDLARTPEEMK